LPSFTGVVVELLPGNDFTGTFTGTASSGVTILLKNSRLNVVPVVGLEQILEFFQNPLLRNYPPTTKGEPPHN
jgi:hypothetical protein